MSTTPTPAPAAQPVKIKRSAGMLTAGILAMVIGQFIYSAGQAQTIQAALTSYSFDDGDGGGALAIGGIVSLLGLVFILIGVVRLAGHVDDIAARVLR